MNDDLQSNYLTIEHRKDSSHKFDKISTDSSSFLNSRRTTASKKPLPTVPNMSMTLNINMFSNQNAPTNKNGQTSRTASSSSLTRNFSSSNQFTKKNVLPPKIKAMRSINTSELELSKTTKIPNISESIESAPSRVDKNLQLASEMDDFFLLLSHDSLQLSVEKYVQEKLNAGQVFFWQAVASVQRFYSNKLNMSVAHNEGLIGYAFHNRSTVVIPCANKHDWYDQQVDGQIVNPTSSLVLFPLFDSMNNLVSIVEVSKKANDSLVTKSNHRFIEIFQKKFRVFSHWILNEDDHNEDDFKDLLNLMEVGQFILSFKRKMIEIFECRQAEIWIYTEKTGEESEIQSKFTLYTENGPVEIDTSQVGIVGEVIHRQQVYNCYINNLQSSYNVETDSSYEEPILAMPYSVSDSVSKKVYIIMIRGQNRKKIFTTFDEKKLAKISKFIFASFINSLFIEELNDSSAANEKLLQSILRIVPKVKERRRPEDVLEISMRELKSFTKADRVTYYEIDRERNILRSAYFEGVKDKIQVPIGTGQCGIAALRGVVLNTANAYEEKFFDPVYDKITKYQTKTLLSVPIINTNGAVGAVIQLLNKQDSKPFSENDASVSQIFGSVCMCLLSSSSLFAELNDSKRRLVELSNAINNLSADENFYDIVTESARSALQCEFVTFYTLDEASLLFHPLSTSSTKATSSNNIKKVFADLSSLNGIASKVMNDKKTFFTNDVKNHEALSDENQEEKKYMISILICPVLSIKKKKVIGLVRAINKRGLFDQNDVKTLESYSIIFSVNHEDEKLREINLNGPAQVKMNKWITINESELTCIPQMLRIPEENAPMMKNLDFNILGWNNNGLYQIMFHVFGSFGLLNRFKITNTTFYSFLFDCKSEYDKKKVKFHNWLHCVEMVQFFSYIANETDLRNTLHARDLFAIFISLTISYISNDGTNNSFNIKTSSPLGLALHSNSNSILETISMIKLIQIMKQEKSNLMKNMNEEDSKYIWALIFKLISISDLNQKDDIVEKAEERFKDATLDMNNSEDRSTLIVLFFRASLMSTYCRPFLISQKWHDMEIAEMLELGDMEEKAKINFTSDYYCRDICNKINHSIEQIEQKVLPLFKILQKGMPDLADTYSSIQSNLKTWTHFKNAKNTDNK